VFLLVFTQLRVDLRSIILLDKLSFIFFLYLGMDRSELDILPLAGLAATRPHGPLAWCERSGSVALPHVDAGHDKTSSATSSQPVGSGSASICLCLLPFT
jgi:hypothetical protein